MEKKLKAMFDYQQFSGNKRLEKMMQEAEKAYPAVLNDEDLFFVNAAGEDQGDKRGEKKESSSNNLF